MWCAHCLRQLPLQPSEVNVTIPIAAEVAWGYRTPKPSFFSGVQPLLPLVLALPLGSLAQLTPAPGFP